MIGDEDEDSGVKEVSYKKEHALEKFLNIEPTEVDKVYYEKKPLTKVEGYDTKDVEIEEQVQEIFNESMQGYRTLESFLDAIEPKYRARMAEVALQYLKTGLDAANSKAKQKENKDKIDLKQLISNNTGSKNTTNVIVTADRNEFLRELRNMANSPVDGEIVEKNESHES